MTILWAVLCLACYWVGFLMGRMDRSVEQLVADCDRISNDLDEIEDGLNDVERQLTIIS